MFPDAVMLAHSVVTPDDVWSAWTADPLVVVPLVAAAVVYGIGARRLRTSTPGRPALRTRQIVSFYAGVMLLGLALCSPLDALGEALFSWHMVQHLVLLLAAPPLIVYGRPVLAAMLALRRNVRRGARWLGGRLPVGRVLLHPFVVWGALAAALWGWHLPRAYQAAVRSDAVHAAEHTTFLLAALGFWALVLGSGHRRRIGHGPALLLVFTTMLHSVWLAMLLSLVPTVVYPVYESGAELWGLDALADQHTAGVIMWVPTSFVMVATIVVLFLRWMRDIEIRTILAEAKTDVRGIA